MDMCKSARNQCLNWSNDDPGGHHFGAWHLKGLDIKIQLYWDGSKNIHLPASRMTFLANSTLQHLAETRRQGPALGCPGNRDPGQPSGCQPTAGPRSCLQRPLRAAWGCKPQSESPGVRKKINSATSSVHVLSRFLKHKRSCIFDE